MSVKSHKIIFGRFFFFGEEEKTRIRSGADRKIIKFIVCCNENDKTKLTNTIRYFYHRTASIRLKKENKSSKIT